MRYPKAHVLATTPASERWSGPRIILTITQTGFKRGFQRDLHEMKLLALHKELVWPTTYQCWHSKYLGIHWVPACLTTVKNLRDRSVDRSSSSVWIRYSDRRVDEKRKSEAPTERSAIIGYQLVDLGLEQVNMPFRSLWSIRKSSFTCPRALPFSIQEDTTDAVVLNWSLTSSNQFPRHIYHTRICTYTLYIVQHKPTQAVHHACHWAPTYNYSSLMHYLIQMDAAPSFGRIGVWQRLQQQALSRLTISATISAILGREEGSRCQHWEHISHHIPVMREHTSSEVGRSGRCPFMMENMMR